MRCYFSCRATSFISCYSIVHVLPVLVRRQTVDMWCFFGRAWPIMTLPLKSTLTCRHHQLEFLTSHVSNRIIINQPRFCCCQLQILISSCCTATYTRPLVRVSRLHLCHTTPVWPRLDVRRLGTNISLSRTMCFGWGRFRVGRLLVQLAKLNTPPIT